MNRQHLVCKSEFHKRNSYQFSECNAVNKGGQPEICDPSERAGGDENQGY